MKQNRQTKSKYITNEQLQMVQIAIFSRYDIDHKGFLEQNEVKIIMRDALCENGKSQEEIDNLTRKFYIETDKNGDGKISKQEFMEVIKSIIERKIISGHRRKIM